MGKVAVATRLDVDTGFDVWLIRGKALLHSRDQIEWALVDWLAEGREEYGNQAQFDFLAQELGIERTRVTQAAKVADAFPPHLRASDLPYEVHAYLAAIPADRRTETLSRASAEHWGEKQAKRAVTEYRHSAAMFEDEDHDTRLAVEILRAWNRGTEGARRHAWEGLSRANFGAVDEDTIYA